MEKSILNTGPRPWFGRYVAEVLYELDKGNYNPESVILKFWEKYPFFHAMDFFYAGQMGIKEWSNVEQDGEIVDTFFDDLFEMVIAIHYFFGHGKDQSEP